MNTQTWITLLHPTDSTVGAWGTMELLGCAITQASTSRQVWSLPPVVPPLLMRMLIAFIRCCLCKVRQMYHMSSILCTGTRFFGYARGLLLDFHQDIMVCNANSTHNHFSTFTRILSDIMHAKICRLYIRAGRLAPWRRDFRHA
jgi:hypothetical protein